MNIRIFRILGIDIKVDISWALIATFIAGALAQGVFPRLYEGLSPFAYWWMALTAIIGLALSIILHELAHSLVAKFLGLPLKSITLFVFGGIAELEAEPKSPLAEFAMAIAGPLMSVALAVLFGWTAANLAAVEMLSTISKVFEYLALINWVLAAFNMLPALPLDGGRVFRSIVWALTGDLTGATRISAKLGMAFATAIMILGVFWALLGQFAAGLWWILIGLFIRSASASTVYQELMQRVFKGAPLREFMSADPITVPPGITVSKLVEDYIYEYHFDLFPVVSETRLVGAVGLKETKNTHRDNWATTKVSDIMVPISDEITIDISADAMDALKKMHSSKHSRLLVTDKGNLVGMIALKDLLDLLSLKMALEGR
ncbi:site-2 protease family protein [Hyphococcus sp. DH-69]|uniref:site-2 protease family protein n=1 Tax=Hyphococcus formosus TaxID=3143534 RepID=UPI00398B357B